MAEVGILKPTDRVELIRGEIVEMSPPGRRHVAFVNNLNQLLVTRLVGRAIVSVQNPVVLAADTEPQPDLAVVRRRAVPYKEAEIATDDDTPIGYPTSRRPSPWTAWWCRRRS